MNFSCKSCYLKISEFKVKTILFKRITFIYISVSVIVKTDKQQKYFETLVFKEMYVLLYEMVNDFSGLFSIF